MFDNDKVGDVCGYSLECPHGWYPVGDLSANEAWELANSVAPNAQWTDEEITDFVGYQYETGKREWPEELAVVISSNHEVAYAIVFWEGNFYILRRRVQALPA